MRRTRPLITFAVLGAVALLPFAGQALGLDLLRTHRNRRHSGRDALQSFPIRFADDAEPCNPALPDLLDPLGPTFDPDNFDQIAVAGDGRYLGYSTLISSAGGPATASEVVLFEEGGRAERLKTGAGGNDQPSVKADPMGARVAYRALGAADMTTLEQSENVVLFSETTVAGTTTSTSMSLTSLEVPLFARYPSLTARTRTIVLKGDIKSKQRDSRVAFVSNGDLELRNVPNPDFTGERDDDGILIEPRRILIGANEDNDEQVFIWLERPGHGRFVQITSNADPAAVMARPAINGDGTAVAFESTGDLDPNSANPLDAGQIGNPDGNRQLFLWRRGRGVRQITWGTGACFAPRISRSGRAVLFCSSADLVAGGNPEGNFEIFTWRMTRNPARRLRQLTQTEEGDSVLPRPTAHFSRFVFYSTATPPKPIPNADPEAPPSAAPAFGSGLRECGGHALSWTPRGVKHIFGALDVENIAFGAADPPLPIVATGPPAVGLDLRKIHFSTNDPEFGGVPTGVPSIPDLSQLVTNIVRATRYPVGSFFEPAPPDPAPAKQD